MYKRVLQWMAWMTLAALSCGCGGHAVKKTTRVNPQAKPVAQEATRDGLLEKYNHFAGGVKSVNATVELRPTAGSKYSGVIEEYHEVKAFLLAQRPANIRQLHVFANQRACNSHHSIHSVKARRSQAKLKQSRARVRAAEPQPGCGRRFRRGPGMRPPP